MKFNEYLKNNLKSIFMTLIYIAIALNTVRGLSFCILYQMQFSDFLEYTIELIKQDLANIAVHFGIFLLVARLKFTFRR